MLRRTFMQTAAAAAFAIVSGAAFAFTAGVDYVKLDVPLPGGEGKLVKIWSYDCRFCRAYDQRVAQQIAAAAQARAGLAFDQYHLEQRGKFGRAASELFAYCRIRDQKAGITAADDPQSAFKKAKDAVYEAYHKQGERWPSGEEAFLKTGLDAAGISAEEFAAERKKDDVQDLADSWLPAYEAAKIQGIPAYVVNGRYLIMTKSLRSIGGMTALIETLARL